MSGRRSKSSPLAPLAGRGQGEGRDRAELLKALAIDGSANILVLMDQDGVLGKLFPILEACRRTAVRFYGKGGVLKHSLNTVENLDWLMSRCGTPLWPLAQPVADRVDAYVRERIGGFPRAAWLRLAALLHDIGKPATAKMIGGRMRFFAHENVGAQATAKIAEKLRCSRREIKMLRQWVQNHMRPGSLAAAPMITDKAPARFFRDLGEDGIGMLLISLADHYDYLPKKQWGRGKDPVEKLTRRFIEQYYVEKNKITPKRLIDGHQLMRALKLKPSPLVGKLLASIQDAQAEGKIKTKKEAIALVKKLI